MLCLAAASFGAAAQEMRPNKDPAPSPSEMRAARGEDRPQGQAREARTPSPSDLATRTPDVEGDLPMNATEDGRRAGAGLTRPAPSPSDLAAPPAPAK